MWVKAKELQSRMQGTLRKGRLRQGGVRGCRSHRKVEEEKIGQTLRLTKRLSGRRGAELPVSATLPLGTRKAHRSILDKRREPAGTFPLEDPLRFARLSRLSEHFVALSRGRVSVFGGSGWYWWFPIAGQPAPQRPDTHAPVVGEAVKIETESACLFRFQHQRYR